MSSKIMDYFKSAFTVNQKVGKTKHLKQFKSYHSSD